MMVVPFMRRLLISTKIAPSIRLFSERSAPFSLERLSGKDEESNIYEALCRYRTIYYELPGKKECPQQIICTAGADLNERKEMSVDEVPRFVDSLRSSFTELETLPQPVIAAIDGYALGGGLELALACDIRVASANAKVGLIETRLAIIPGAGGTQRLSRVVGISMAKELIFTGRVISGEEANRIGLVNHCTQSDAFAKAVDIAREILPKGPIAIRVAKTAVRVGSEMSLDCGLVMEQQCYAQVSCYLSWFHNLQMEEEREKSLLCDFEMKSIQDDKLIAKREELERSGKDLSELEEQIGVINATIEDGWSKKGEQLMAKCVAMLQISNDSARDVNDEHSLQRMLDRKLLLIVQQRFEQEGYKSPWILPQIKHVSGESLRDVCFHLVVPIYFIRGFRC
ncbi:unnamed protein product [Angiostrongylus costaricensis]|uniref:Enoyl-CoA hydratase 2, mitochondrial n=1 Tax=Angiostrongylus costaricensis TaxID=334426 RepID=A0A0R3PYM9_ANGCS|nr:unnamed protein product [Angiostrongylus costaricensis]